MICAYREEEVGRMFRFLRVFALLPVLFFTSNLMAAGYMCTSDAEYVECDSGYYLTRTGAGNSCASCLTVSNNGIIAQESISNGTRTTRCNGLFTGGVGGTAVGTSSCTGCTNPTTTCSCNSGYTSVSSNGTCLCQNVSDSGYMCDTLMKFTHCSAGYFLNGTGVGNDCVSCTQYTNTSVISSAAIANGSRITQCFGFYTGGTGGDKVGATAACTGCSNEFTYCSCDDGYVASGSGDSCTCALAAGYTCDLTYSSCNAGYFLDDGMCESCTDASVAPRFLTDVENGKRYKYCTGNYTGGTAGANGVSQCTGCSKDSVYMCECNDGYHDDGNGETCECRPDDPGVCEVTSRTYTTCKAGYYLTNGTCLQCTSFQNNNVLETDTNFANGTRQLVCKGTYTGGTAGNLPAVDDPTTQGKEGQCSGCSKSEWVISCNKGYVENLAGECVEAVGYSCPELKKYSSCSSGYYMATQQSDGTYSKFGVVQAGNECVACPTGWKCDGGTASPYVMVTAYVQSTKGGEYVATGSGVKVRYGSMNVGLTGFSSITTAPAGYEISTWNSGQDCTGTAYFNRHGAQLNNTWNVLNPATKLYACYSAKKVLLNFVDPLGAYTPREPEPGEPTVYYWAEYDSTNAGDGFSGSYGNGPLPIPSKEGYSFNGWYYKADCDGATDCTASQCCDATRYFDSTGKMVRTWNIDASSVKLYARWDSHFTLDAGPGNFKYMGNKLSVYRVYGCGLGETVVNYGGSEALALEQRMGYTFNGFYTGQNCSGTQVIDGNGKQLHNNTLPNSTLYACWTPACTPITLNPNGGTAGTVKTLYFKPGSETLYEDAACTDSTWTFVDITPSRTGYYFVGFMAAEQDYSDVVANSTLNPIIAPERDAGTPYLVNDGLVYMQNALKQNRSPVVYAKWLKEPQMTGIGTVDFDPWYTWINQGTTEFEVEYNAYCGDTRICNTSSVQCSTGAGLCADGFTLTEIGTATPVCTPKTYTVSFESGGGTATSPITVTYGETYSAPLPKATKTGYTLTGWSTEPGGQGCNWYVDNGAEELYFDSMEDPWNIPENTILYPIWTPNKYTVTYNLDGGNWGATSTTQSIDYGASWSIAYDTFPVRKGYEFGGFYDAQNCSGTQYVGATANSSASLLSTRAWNKTANATLYACWKSVKNKIIIDPNGGTVAENTLCFRADSDIVLYGDLCDIEVWDWDDNVKISRPGYVFAGLTYDANWKNDITEDLPDDYYPTVTPEHKPNVPSGANPPRIQGISHVIDAMTCDASGVNCTIPMYAMWVKEPVLTNGSGNPGVGDAFVNVGCDWSDGYCNLIVSYNASCGDATTCGSSDSGLCADGFTLSGELTAAPMCTPKTYTVSFNNDGGTATSPITVTFGSDRGAAEKPSKTGYTFNGYYTSRGCAGDMWYDGSDLSTLQDIWNIPANTALYACWAIKSDINVPAGYYLPMGTDIPVACEENHYCGGIEDVTFSTVANQGIVACPDNYYTDGTGASAKADCKISCPGGYYLEQYGDTECTPAGVGNWIPASTYSWDNELGAVNECPEGETTIGYGPGADEDGDCGRKFHVGANILYLRSEKRTTPSLNVLVDGKQYYGNMSEYTSGMTKADAKMSADATDVLRITDALTNKEYWVHDDSRL